MTKESATTGRSSWLAPAAGLFSLLFLGVALSVARAQDTASATVTKWKAPPYKARKKNPITTSPESIALGKKFYKRECHSCHGTEGKGDGPSAKDLEREPGNLSDPEMWKQTDGAIFWKMTVGRTPMPSFRELLTDEERWNVVNYVRTLAPKSE